MFSKEFMKYLINYQTPEFNENTGKKVLHFNFGMKTAKLAPVLLTVKK